VIRGEGFGEVAERVITTKKMSDALTPVVQWEYWNR
jgi:hypothetical protein